MHSVLQSLKNELVQIVAQVKSTMANNEPLGNVHNNWSCPGLTRDELAQEARSVIELIDIRGGDDIGTNESVLSDYIRRLAFLRASTIPQLGNGNAGQAVSAFRWTIDGLRKALGPALGDENAIAIAASKNLKSLLTKLRGIEQRIEDIAPRSGRVAKMIEDIEHAHEAADRLPTDMQTLRESRDEIERLLGGATQDRGDVQRLLKEVSECRVRLAASEEEASVIIARCDEAYRTSTSEGLAAAFAERSHKLSASMWIWVAGLILALVIGATLGTHQLKTLTDVIDTPGSKQDAVVWINIFLSLLSIGAPVWFAWISTKQIGQRFRLSEDYGYKASISKAYEGYRREALMLDKDFQFRLFSSALTRLDELPLRLVENESHGSPWHELASSDAVRQAMKTVPGFADNIAEMAKNMVSDLTTSGKRGAKPAQPERPAPTPAAAHDET